MAYQFPRFFLALIILAGVFPASGCKKRKLIVVLPPAASQSSITVNNLPTVSVFVEPVEYQELVADFYTDIVLGAKAPALVEFTDNSSGNPAGWLWDFNNDGAIDSVEPNPTFIYEAPGHYTVVLTVVDSRSFDTITRTRHIFIAERVWYVDGESAAGSDGASWDTAFQTIGEGLGSAASFDLVLVAEGTYRGAGNMDLDFAGRGVYLASANGSDTCVIDCQGAGRGLVFASGETVDSVLKGFTITGGSSNQGGAVYCYNSSPSIADCTFALNVSTDRGGAVYCYMNASPSISNCRFRSNQARSGGAIDCFDGCSPAITGCTFENNTATSVGGGGVYLNLNCSPTITECVFKSNLSNVGGAITASTASAPEITRCLFENNAANYMGGAIYFRNGADALVTGSSFDGNMAHDPNSKGGAIYCNGSSPVFINCTIARNMSDFGGGIYCTGNSDPSMKNTILWNNTAGTEGDQVNFFDIGSSLFLSYSCYDDRAGDFSGPGNLDYSDNCIFADPLFAGSMLQLSSSPVLSPCIDGGDNEIDQQGLMVDLDGKPRFVKCDGTDNVSGPVDIGAYEYQP